MITSVILKGIKIEVGDKVRFIDDRKLYESGHVKKPEVGKVYEVSGFTIGADGNPGFTLVGIINGEILGIYHLPCGGTDVGYLIPGFAITRFEPAFPQINEEELAEAFSKALERVLVKGYDLSE